MQLSGSLLRVLNNNAVMVDADGHRMILLGRGIGFGRRLGDAIPLADAVETFSPSTPLELRQLVEFAREIPLDVFQVARHAIAHGTQVAGIRPTQALLLSIADHLNFAVQRATLGQVIEFPLSWEIAELYPEETELGHLVVALAGSELGVRIHADEATAFAMHFVNAQFARADVRETVTMTEDLQSVLRVIEAGLGAKATADSMSVARFITHLRYLYARIAKSAQISSAPPVSMSALRETHPEVPAVAAQVRAVVERRGAALSAAEVAYLELHVARLASTVRQAPPPHASD